MKNHIRRILVLTSAALVTLALIGANSLNAEPVRVNRDSGAHPNMTDRLGLGAMLGEPSGLSGKYWTGPRTAIDGGVAWSTNANNDFHLHMDYLIHDFRSLSVEKGSLPLYYGIGGRIKFDNETRLGVRAPVGLAYMFANSPLDLFVEIAPILDLAPATELEFNGAFGIRYFFK